MTFWPSLKSTKGLSTRSTTWNSSGAIKMKPIPSWNVWEFYHSCFWGNIAFRMYSIHELKTTWLMWNIEGESLRASWNLKNSPALSNFDLIHSQFLWIITEKIIFTCKWNFFGEIGMWPLFFCILTVLLLFLHSKCWLSSFPSPSKVYSIRRATVRTRFWWTILFFMWWTLFQNCTFCQEPKNLIQQ